MERLPERLSHSLDGMKGAGLAPQFFHHLWSKTNTPKSCDGIVIPHTIIYYRQQPVEWYFMKDGQILKKNQRHLNSESIMKVLSRPRKTDIIAYLLTTSTNDVGVAFNKIIYFNEYSLRRFLFDRDKPVFGMLQEFIEPKNFQNTTIKVDWTREVSYVFRRRSVNRIDDMTKAMHERADTFTGLETSEDVPPIARFTFVDDQCTDKVIQMVFHIRNYSIKKYNIVGMEAHFKVGPENQIYFLFAAHIDISSQSFAAPPAPPPRALPEPSTPPRVRKASLALPAPAATSISRSPSFEDRQSARSRVSSASSGLIQPPVSPKPVFTRGATVHGLPGLTSVSAPTESQRPRTNAYPPSLLVPKGNVAPVGRRASVSGASPGAAPLPDIAFAPPDSPERVTVTRPYPATLAVSPITPPHTSPRHVSTLPRSPIWESSPAMVNRGRRKSLVEQLATGSALHTPMEVVLSHLNLPPAEDSSEANSARSSARSGRCSPRGNKSDDGSQRGSARGEERHVVPETRTFLGVLLASPSQKGSNKGGPGNGRPLSAPVRRKIRREPDPLDDNGENERLQSLAVQLHRSLSKERATIVALERELRELQVALQTARLPRGDRRPSELGLGD